MGSVVFTSTYSASGWASATFNMRVTYSETWNASTRQTAIKVTAVEIQKVNNSTNFGSMTLRGYITCQGSNIVSFGQGSYSVTISISGSGYCSVNGFSSGTVYVAHADNGTASATFGAAQYGSLQVIGAFYDSTYQLGVKAQTKSVSLTTRAAKTYAVTYSANGHGTAPASQTKSHGTNLTLRPFIENQVEQGSTSWYLVTGNANGGTWSGENGSATVTPTEIYSQAYWNTNSSGTGTNYGSSATYTGNAALSLYAIWSKTATTYSYTYTLPTGTPTKDEVITVTFNPNGGTTTKASQNSNRAMTFNGWWTDPVAGVQRTTSSEVSNSETIYAHYLPGSGSFSTVTLPTTQQCTKGTTELLGWSTDSSAITPDYLPGATYVPTENTILYAVWKSEGSVHIDNGISFDIYAIYIDNGTSWDQYVPYIDNGTSWDIYS